LVSEPAIANASALHDSVLTAVGRDIATGILATGRVITLDDIGIQYRVSRSLAREVIRVLESMGMVASRRRIGITVLPDTSWNVFDPRLIRWRLASPERPRQVGALLELRRGYEPVAAALAAERAPGALCRELAAVVSDLQVALRHGDDDAFGRSDKDFHDLLLQACGNEMFVALGRLCADGPSCGPDDEAVELHDAVARAIRQADAGSAERGMRAICQLAGRD